MAMIEVSCLRKDFVKIIKEPGLKGAIRSFIHPEKQILKRLRIYRLRFQRDKF